MTPIPSWYYKLPLILIREYAEKHGINKNLLAAMVMVESGGNPNAKRYEAGYKWPLSAEMTKKYADRLGIDFETEYKEESTSWGLVQVMGTVAREHGFLNRLPMLCNPSIGLEYGCMHLGKMLKRWPLWKDAVSAYNQGSPRKKDDGSNDYKNQKYVDLVFKYCDEISTK